MIIGLSGYSGSGKDAVGTIIQYLQCRPTAITLEEVLNNYVHNEWWLVDESEWQIKKWAGKLKVIASLLTGIDKNMFEDQQFKKTNLGPEWNKARDTTKFTPKESYIIHEEIPMSVREFLQKLGTDGLRDGLHPNTWVNALMADYKATGIEPVRFGGTAIGKYPNWIITDTRFPNEAEAIKKAEGIIIRVDRPGVKPINNHPSEVGLDNWNFDYKIANVSDLEALTATVKNILVKENIL